MESSTAGNTVKQRQQDNNFQALNRSFLQPSKADSWLRTRRPAQPVARAQQKSLLPPQPGKPACEFFLRPYISICRLYGVHRVQHLLPVSARSSASKHTELGVPPIRNFCLFKLDDGEKAPHLQRQRFVRQAVFSDAYSSCVAVLVPSAGPAAHRPSNWRDPRYRLLISFFPIQANSVNPYRQTCPPNSNSLSATSSPSRARENPA